MSDPDPLRRHGHTSGPTGVPTVSVVIPCYNLGRYLDEAVDSVLTQTFQDFEILVVDDGSTDPDTRQLLAEYHRPKTRVLHSENRGLAGARNLGVRESEGPFVCALDADDRLAPTWLEKATDVLRADPGVAFVSHWLRTFGDEEWEWKPERCDLPALLDANTVNGAALVRRHALLAVGGFDESMRHGCEDWELWLRMVAGGFRGAIVPEVLFFYRRRSDSMSRVMMEGEVYLGTYRRLLERHAGACRAHVGELVVRREERIAELLRAVHDLEVEHETWLSPEVARWRAAVAALRAKAEREAARRARLEELETALRAEEERGAGLKTALGVSQEQTAGLDAALRAAREQTAGLDAALRAAREQTAGLDAALRAAREQTAGLDAALAGARGEIAALRGSMSWRITGPLRAAYRLLGTPGAR